MPTILITGASRGIGFETARQYAGDGWRVIATCRNPENADALRALKGDVVIEKLDLEASETIDDVARRYGEAAIDILFLNAGINPQNGAALEETDFGAWPQAFLVNCIATCHVAFSLLEPVARSKRKIIAAVGTLGGSSVSSMPSNYVYRTSKAALHSAMQALARDVASRGIIVTVLHPGRVKVARAPQNTLLPEESVAGMRQVLEGLTLDQSGGFLSHEGEKLPW